VLLLSIGPRLLWAQDGADPVSSAKSVTVLTTDYSYVGFDDGLRAWRYSSVSIGRRGSAGSLIGRVNYANRFGTSGMQVEADAYPRLSRHAYAYVSAGYSQSDVFPAWRSGSELFVSLPNGWESSAGYRQLRFHGTPVTLFTGAVGKYVGNYWFSLRPYVRQKTNGTSSSTSLTARRYFADADHFIGVRAGYGSAPSDQAVPDALALERTQSFSASSQGSVGIHGGVLCTWTVSYDSEALSASRTRNSWTANAGLKFLF
jgi:YaiO family outer membrane protein